MKFNLLLRKRALPDRAAFRQTAAYTLAFFFAAHAFCFFNLTYSTGSVMLNVAKGQNAQIAAGQYLLPIYWRIRGSISSPLFVGMLSALYMTLTVLTLVWLLELKQPLARFMLCGALSVNAAILSICAGSMHTADATLLAMLLAALACAACMHIRFGVIPGAFLLAGALALEPGSLAFFASLTFISALRSLLLSGQKKSFLMDIVYLLLALCAGLLVYLLGFALMLRLTSLDAQTSLCLWGGNPVQAYLAPIRAMFEPLTAYPALNTLIRILFVLLCAYAVVRCARERGGASAVLLGAGMLALPLLAGLTFLSGQEAVQITPAHCLADVLVIVLLFGVFSDSVRLHRGAAAAFSVLFLGSIVFSNQVYLKKNLEFESTLSVMTRAIARIEEVPQYQPGYTPVAIIGTPEDSVLSSERTGFEHLSALDAASGNYAIANDMDMIWYAWEVLGYPLNFVSTFELEQLKQHPEVQALPAFPQEGCCTMIDGILVLRLS